MHKTINILGIKIKIKDKKVEIVKPRYHSQDALYKLVKDYNFQTILDIGSGDGQHSEYFKQHGKMVTSIDYGESPYFEQTPDKDQFIIADFMKYDFGNIKYDAIWCSHVLEHTLNPHLFLIKINELLKDDGILAITVPFLKQQIVGGHINLYNTGILLYRLVLAGFDCSNAIAKKYQFSKNLINVSIILKKKKIDILNELGFDAGDITKIKKYLPPLINFYPWVNDVSFDGDIENINWVE